VPLWLILFAIITTFANSPVFSLGSETAVLWQDMTSSKSVHHRLHKTYLLAQAKWYRSTWVCATASAVLLLLKRSWYWSYTFGLGLNILVVSIIAGFDPSFRISAFNLRATGIALRFLGNGANCSCVKEKHYLTVLTWFLRSQNVPESNFPSALQTSSFGPPGLGSQGSKPLRSWQPYFNKKRLTYTTRDRERQKRQLRYAELESFTFIPDV